MRYGHEMYCREKYVYECSEHRRCIAAGVAGPVNRPRPYTGLGPPAPMTPGTFRQKLIRSNNKLIGKAG